MASRFDVVFAFKRMFNDAIAADIISNLRNHPAIWSYLSEENNYLRIANILGSVRSNWKAAHILDAIISNGSSFEGLASSAGILELISSVQLIQSQIESDDWETVIFRTFENEKLDQTFKLNQWGTVFSYFFDKELNPYDLVDALIESGPYGVQITAFLIKNRTIASDQEFLTGSIKKLLSKPVLLIEISEQLATLDSPDHAEVLIKTYFGLIDSAENRKINSSESKSLDFSSEIQRLIELSVLAKFIKDEPKEHNYLTEATELMQALSKNIAKDDKVDILLLEKAKNLRDFDKDHARAIYLEWIGINENIKGLQSIARLPIQRLQEIVSNFLYVDLHIPILLFIEKILAFTGRKPEFEKLIGDVCAVYGDQARVIKYFLPLNGEGVLSRDQKNKLTNAFVYYEDWKSAEIVFRSVNLISTTDKLFGLLCKLKADPLFDLGLSINDLTSANPKSHSFLMLKRIMIDEKIDTSYLSKLPEDESKIVLWILYDYFSKAGKAKLLSFLAEAKEVSPHSKYLYITNFSELMPSSEVNTLYSNLLNAEDINDQKLYENIIDDLMEKELDIQLEKILNINSWKWPLSKVNFQNVITKQLNDQNFTQAKSNLEMAIAYFPPNNTLITLYGAYLLRTTIHELPFTLQKHLISDGEKHRFQKLLNQIGDQELSVVNQILKIEILSNTKTNDYLELGTKELENDPLNRWKVLHALSNHFFHQKKFDQVIIYLTEARKLFTTSDSSLHMLISSYIQLKMFDEATNLIQQEFEAGKSFQFRSLRKISDFLYENDRFYQFLIDGGMKEPQNITHSLALVRVLILRGLELEASNLLIHLEGKISQRDAAMIDVADLYHEAGEAISAKRVIDTFLSNKQDLDDQDLILSARLFFDLGLYEKSLNILTMIDDEKINIDFARSSIYLKTDKVNLASQALMQGTLKPERKMITTVVDRSSIPESWIILDETLLEGIIIDFMKVGETDQLSRLLTFIKREAEADFKLISFICNTAQLTGNFGFLDGYLQGGPKDKSIELLPVRIARITEGLIQKHEIEAALLLSEIDRSKYDTPLLELLEIRLQIRQNLESKTGEKLNTIFEQVIERINNPLIGNETKLDALVFQLNLTEALLEYHQFIKAYSILKNIIKEIGFTSRGAACYREIIANIFFEKKINEILLIKNHDLRLDDEDEVIFAHYLATTQGNEDPLLPVGEPPAEPLLSQSDYAEQIIESGSVSDLFVEDDLLCLVSSIEENPHEAIEGLTNLLKIDGNNPRILFALGLAYRQINDYTKSYAPIRLALDVWPDEHVWQEIAADLCEKTGDNLNAARHRNLIQKHSGLNSDSIGEKYQYIQNLIDDCVYGEKDIPYRDMPVLLSYADDLASWNSEDIAGRIVSRILKVSPKNLRAQILNIEILLKQKNFSKVQDILSELRSEHPDELKVIELQVRYLTAIDDLQAANDLVAEIYTDKGSFDGVISIIKAEILEKQSGVKSALVFLTEHLEQSNDVSFSQEAITYLIQKNDFQSAQKYINRLLQIDSNDTESLFIAGKIAEATGDLDQALAYYNRAITTNPFSSNIYIACAELYDTRRQFDLTQKLLEEGVRHNPNDFTLLKYVGNYYKRIGKDQYSVECLRRAYTINGYDKDLESTLLSKEG